MSGDEPILMTSPAQCTARSMFTEQNRQRQRSPNGVRIRVTTEGTLSGAPDYNSAFENGQKSANFKSMNSAPNGQPANFTST